MSNEIFKNYTDEHSFAKIVDYENASKLWLHCAKEYQDRTAIVEGDVSYTYQQLDCEIRRFRTVLSNHQVDSEELVGIFCPNSIGFAKAFLAAATLAIPSVLLPVHLDEMTVMGCTMKFGIKAIIYDETLSDKLALVREKLPSVTLIPVSQTAIDETDPVFPDSSALCTVLFTGGTTGKSKGAKLSHRAVMAGTKNGCYGVRNIFFQKYLLVLPLTHAFGLIRNMLTVFCTGSTLCICKNNKDMFKDCAIHKPTIMVLVPAIAEMALKLSHQFGRNMLGSDLKTIICGAAFVPPYLIAEYNKLGIALLPGYGLTESATLVSGNPEALRNPNSVGYMYSGMEYKIVDGELWLKGDNITDGYLNGEDNAIAFEDGYFKTGDLVRIDDEGFLYIVGRLKEIIVLPSGENVSPAEIEAKFYADDAIQDCLVYDDPTTGTLVIEILPRADIVSALQISDVETYMKDVTTKINETLPPFEKITKVIIRDTDFVRTPAMKIARKLNGNVQK